MPVEQMLVTCHLDLTSNNVKYTYGPHNSNMLLNAKPVSFENCSKVPEAVIGLGYP